MQNKFSTRLRRQKQFRQKTLSNLAFLLVLIVPIYPVFGSYMQSYTGVVVRGEYDRSTILASYDWETGETTSDFIETLVQTPPETTLIAPEPSPEPEPTAEEAPKQTIDPKRGLYVTHTVVRGDTISTIAQKYGIPIATLRTMNNLNTDILSINQKITIPRINGVQYAIQKGDTISTIAQKYGIKDMNTILIANDMSRNSKLSVGKQLLLPNPTKDPTKKPVPQVAKAPAPVDNTAKKAAPAPAPVAKKALVVQTPKDPLNITYGGYSLSLKVSKGCRNFVWGNCTCFVAKYKNVTWRGNAKDWIRNAKKQGVPTGNDPRPGSIIVYHGAGFPPAYGHVGIVMAVNDDHMIIKDMNYRALNEVTTRRESFNNPAIIGYIYVD
ncbi:LysM peptidoglycan-binding domain-containing protein [Candidatus Gracilibacteria bacterium]|nr:LysM peptidoglycan-binding domain-containing protein [Candidatus Gracilibacteria bacterium]